MGERAIVCTLNLWSLDRWPERRDSLSAFLRLHDPDLLCVQELRPETLAVLTEALPGHDRVQDPFPGWTGEGNVLWRRGAFMAAAHGAEDIGMLERDRRLFWVRLRRAGGGELLVATAHFTWPGNARESADGVNVRMEQARRAAAALAALAPDPEPALFLGDFNDHYHPIRILKAAGFQDCFTGLGRIPRATRPAAPTYKGPQQTVDWILYRGGLRPMTCEAADFFLGDIAPSDHKPVMATFAFEGSPPVAPAQGVVPP